jgi:hypothetical protein
MQQEVRELPSGLVRTRWTVNARSTYGSELPSEEDLGKPDAGALHAVLYFACMELLAMGRTSRQAFEIELSHVSRAKAEISSMKIDTEDNIDGHGDSANFTGVDAGADRSNLADVHAPPRVRSRGRPRQSRFKSPIESPGARKKPSTVGPVANLPKKRSVADEETNGDSHQRRKCKLCGEFGHYRSTCGRKSSYKANIAV